MYHRYRTTSQPRIRRKPFQFAVIASLLLMPMLASAFPFAVVNAGEPGDGGQFTLGQRSLVAPSMDRLSGASWAALSGLDPRVQPIETDGMYVGQGVSSVGAGVRSTGGVNQQVPFRNPAPSFSRNILVTRNLGNFPVQTEPSVAVDPTDSEHVVLSTIDYNTPGNVNYVTFDGGETWQGPIQTGFYQEDIGAGGDPMVVFDQDGTVYQSTLSIGVEEFSLGNILSADNVTTMAVSKSTDGGLSWTEPVSAARSTITTQSDTSQDGKERGLITASFFDKEWMAVGPDPDDPDQQILYLTYTDFQNLYTITYADEVPFLTAVIETTQINVVSSRDGGVTWSKPVAASPLATISLSATGSKEGEEIQATGGFSSSLLGGAAGAGGTLQQGAGVSQSERYVQGSEPKVLADGTLVVLYYDSTSDGQGGLAMMSIAKSHDAGKSFDTPILAGVVREAQSRLRTSRFRFAATQLPQLEVGPKGEIYIAVTAGPVDKTRDDGDIYLIRSLDEGKTWDLPQRINTDDTTHVQFFPSIDVSPDGTVHLMWGDMRDDPQQVRYNIYYSKSEDQGKTWGFSIPDQNFTAPDTRVTDFASNSLKGFPDGRFLGDYFSMAAADDAVYIVWPDTRLGEFGGFSQQIAFARNSAIKPASLFLNPPSGTAGRVVAIQGFGYQPDSNIQLLVSGQIVANQRTNEKGEFQASIYMPLTGEGPTSITAYDETGNAATASFYTEFGFDTLQRSLEAINGQLGLPDQGSPGGTPSAPPAASPASGAPAATPVS